MFWLKLAVYLSLAACVGLLGWGLWLGYCEQQARRPRRLQRRRRF